MFTIKITETVTTEVQQQEWQRLTAADDSKYGYVAIPGRFVKQTRDVLTQELETVDLAAVIRAVNKL